MNNPARYGRGLPDEDGLPAAGGWEQACEQKGQHWTDCITDLMGWMFGGNPPD